MLHISACDDDDFTLRQIGRMLEQAIEKSREKATLSCLARTGKDLLRSLESHEGPNLIFLDFDLGRQSFNGMDLVRYLYDTDQNAMIQAFSRYIRMAADEFREHTQTKAKKTDEVQKIPPADRHR